MRREPIFNVPGVVLAVLGLFCAVHVLRAFLTPEEDSWFVLAMAFIPARLDGFAMHYPGGEPAIYTSFFTHALIHGDLTHLAFNGAWLLAFGTAVVARIGAVRFLIFIALTAAAGAATFYVFHPGLEAPVVGASGAVAGLMGGALRFLFPALADGGLRRLRSDPKSIPLLSLADALRDRRIQFASAAFFLINFLAMLGISTGVESGRIAWEAHIGGYIAGLMLFGLFERPADTDPQPSFQ